VIQVTDSTLLEIFKRHEPDRKGSRPSVLAIGEEEERRPFRGQYPLSFRHLCLQPTQQVLPAARCAIACDLAAEVFSRAKEQRHSSRKFPLKGELPLAEILFISTIHPFSSDNCVVM
jgi:hypothetical protein